MKTFIADLVLSAFVSVHTAMAQTASTAAIQSPQQPNAVTIHLRFQEIVSSANARVGQHVSLEVAEDALADGSLVVHRGTPVDGKVIKAVHRGHNRRNGELIVGVESVRLADGSLRQVSSAQAREGNSTTLPIFGPCTFPFPADPASLFHRGQNVVIPSGTEMTALLVPVHQ